jgi:N-acetylglucosaminyl-diphospho-decaprenol L-rhamnosyltransferase
MAETRSTQLDFLSSSDAHLDVCVVVVTYKCAALTLTCLKSLEEEVRSSGLSVRVIVVDNASGDHPAVQAGIEANGWSDWAQSIVAPRNGGFAYGNNFGIRMCLRRASYVYMLNPDTEIRPRAIRVLFDFLESHPQVGIAGGTFENLDGSDWPIAFRFPTLWSEIEEGIELRMVSRLLSRWIVAKPMAPLPQEIDWICGAAVMVRRKVFEKVGGLDENYFLYFEETDFCRRAGLAGFSTWYVPESRVMHIAGQSTQVTDRSLPLRRLPKYWFDSRRRYFVMAYGVQKAMLIDLVAVPAQCLGLLKRKLLGRPSVPCFVRDLIRYSIIRRRNRESPEVKAHIQPV